MPRKFYKHKTLLDEHISPRQFFTRLNQRFDVKHIKHDLHLGDLGDPDIYELALLQGRIILTKNVKDFRPLLEKDSPGIIGIPETWLPARVDTKLTALLMKHGPKYFQGHYRSLVAEERKKQSSRN